MADTKVGAGSSNPLLIPGTPGNDSYYVSTLGNDVAVMDNNSGSIVLRQPLSEAKKRGLQFTESQGDDTYEIGSDMLRAGVPIRVDDRAGFNRVENSAGDWVSGTVTGMANNMGATNGGVRAEGGSPEAMLQAMERQLRELTGGQSLDAGALPPPPQEPAVKVPDGWIWF